ncbi:MAG: BlaI/MecI/CopY family transcriptional regulator [Oscillibacter sp.]|nr:BlaI/MecI/CopY family transcriptional regulator [Oscillibacter sp.]
MWEAESKITDAELEIMRALWDSEEPMTLRQLKGVLAERHGWSGDTTKTLLRRLCEKGAVEQEKRQVYYYRPLVKQDQLGQYRTKRLIDKLYAGSAKAMVAALVEHVDEKDAEELRAYFQALWEEK